MRAYNRGLSGGLGTAIHFPEGFRVFPGNFDRIVERRQEPCCPLSVI